MADSANTFTSLLPLFKEQYGSTPNTHKRPGKPEIFSKLKKKLKEKK